MMNLVGYASDSDNEETWDQPTKKVVNETKIKLPTVSTKPIADKEEGDLEDFLKSRKDWEKELAEEAKSQKQSTVAKKKTNALGGFGALLNKPLIDDSVDEDNEEDRSATLTPKMQESIRKPVTSQSELLKMLPQPVNKNPKSASKIKLASVLLPHSLTTSKRPHPKEDDIAIKLKGRDSDEDDEEITDFFGFSSAKTDSIPTTVETQPSFLKSTHFYNDVAGPSRPELKNQDVEVSKAKLKTINDERAQKLVYDKELKPWGLSDNAAREAILNIKEVNVDNELGPNVHETLLRNLNNKSMAQVSAAQLSSVKKGPTDRLAKQKHQITHLAQMAVAREEQLQEQWAESKSKRISTAKRYGFR